MKRVSAAAPLIGIVLALAVASAGGGLLGRHAPRLALGGDESARLHPATRDYLEHLSGRVSLTYFVTERRRMPSSMKGVEEPVRALLDRVAAAAPGKIDVRVIDPTLDPSQGPAYASQKGASPVEMREVVGDESGEGTVWSSLAGAHDRHPDALLDHITASDLPHLEDWLVRSLTDAEQPVQPVIAVSAPRGGFTRVRELLRAAAAESDRSAPAPRVIEVDLDRSPAIPREADWLVWIEPEHVTREHAVELERFLDSGRSAVVAGSLYSIEAVTRPVPASPGYRANLSRCDWPVLLEPFGLSLDPELVFDRTNETIGRQRPDGSLAPPAVPFPVVVPPTQIESKFLRGAPPRLLVGSVSPIRIEPSRLATEGRTAEVVATTSEHTRMLAIPSGEFDDRASEEARPVSKQPWLVLVQPSDGWRGDLLVSGSSTLFHDAPYGQSENGNQAFLRTLLRTFAQPSRLTRIRVPRPEPPRFSAPSAAARLGWRATVLFGVPALLLGVSLRVARGAPNLERRARGMRVAMAAAAGLVLLVAASRVASRVWNPEIDLTDDRVNAPSPVTKTLLDAVRDGLEVELVATEPQRVPSALKSLEPRVMSMLRNLGLRPRVVRPEDLPAAERDALSAQGIEPFDVERTEADATASARIVCALELSRQGHAEVLARLDERAFQHLEHWVAAAARRLGGAPPRRVAVLSDLPRLSPAEALDLQQRGYTAPVGSDVYSSAKDLIARQGYQLVEVNPTEPTIPANTDLFIWLQPRFTDKLLPALSAYMAGGGHALVALQHYNIQQRQYVGAGFKTVYWPQPQWHGFNDYTQTFGVRQVGEKIGEQPGEILFDRSHADLELETQVHRSGLRERDTQQVSLPFLIRATAEQLSRSSVVTSRLGALLFIWGSRFTVDAPRLETLGLHATTLATTSPSAWTYAWGGGWIPPERFAEPDTGKLGPQPLALFLEGSFPDVQWTRTEEGHEVVNGARAQAEPKHTGQMMLIGSSEMFKNPHLFEAGYQHSSLLLDAVALLADGPELAEVQARQRAPRAFGYRPAEAKARWREVIVLLPVLLFAGYGALHRLVRRRPVLRGGPR